MAFELVRYRRLNELGEPGAVVHVSTADVVEILVTANPVGAGQLVLQGTVVNTAVPENALVDPDPEFEHTD